MGSLDLYQNPIIKIDSKILTSTDDMWEIFGPRINKTSSTEIFTDSENKLIKENYIKLSKVNNTLILILEIIPAFKT